MKKLLALVLALLMVLGCMSITVFAEEPNNVTAITAVKQEGPGPGPEPGTLSYEIVIPEAVTIEGAGVKPIGQPSVESVENAEDNTVISYTAVGTQLTLEGSDKTMETTYYKAYTNRANNSLLTDNDSIVVYQNKAVVDSLTTLSVGVSKSAWDAAEAGTYSATITFNFTSGGAPCDVNEGIIYRVIRKDAQNGAFATYSGNNVYYSIGTIDQLNTNFGEGFKVGDCFHYDEDGQIKKCINPETHSLAEAGNGILITVKIGDYLFWCVPDGTTVVLEEDGNLKMTLPGLGAQSLEEGEWYLNNDKIEKGVTILLEEYDVLENKSAHYY